jgi:hypothetical protein
MYNRPRPAERILYWVLEYIPEMLIISIIIGGLAIALIVLFPSGSTQPTQPPPMNAPLLQIVRYCEPLGRDRHSSFNGKTTNVWYTDNPEKFLECMQGYEYQVKR